jgi:hypothetical protein
LCVCGAALPRCTLTKVLSVCGNRHLTLTPSSVCVCVCVLETGTPVVDTEVPENCGGSTAWYTQKSASEFTYPFHIYERLSPSRRFDLCSGKKVRNKAIIKPVWTYGIELWECSKPSNTKILQTFQSKTLRKLSNSPCYISNVTLRNDLSIPYVTEVIRTYAKNHKNRTAQNNQLIKDLFNQPEIGRRLNRMWPEDLIR